LGGIDLFRSENEGDSWNQISKWSNNNNLNSLNVPYVHADQHCITINPSNSNEALIGNDGGVFFAKSLNRSSINDIEIEERNNGFNITQFYKGDIGPSTTNEIFVAGAQDNGTQLTLNAKSGVNSSKMITGGDGAYCFIDEDEKYIITSSQYSRLYRIDPPYNKSIEINPYVIGGFINAMDLDSNLNQLYGNGTFFGTIGPGCLVRFYDLKSTRCKFKRYYHELLKGGISTIKVSRYTNTSSVVFVGTHFGKLIRIDNANTKTPVFKDISGSKFNGSISSIALGRSEEEIIVTFHNYDVTSIWYTQDGGRNWKNKEGNMPDIPVKCVIMNPNDSKQIFIGTQIGVWYTNDFNEIDPTWKLSKGIPTTKITSFSLREKDNTILATTYGRGLYTKTLDTDTLSNENNNNVDNNILLYPTVLNGTQQITIESNKHHGPLLMNMYNTNGQLVFNKLVDLNKKANILIHNGIPSGVYFVKITYKGKLIFKTKIVIY
jgi:hypothetical protein